MFEFHVRGMRCKGCASRVTKTIQMVDNGAVVDIMLDRKAVRISSKDKIDEIAVALAEAGYPATILA